MRLAYAILAHEPFAQIKPLLECLTANGDIIVLHYDKATEHCHDIELITRHFPEIIIAERVEVEWGESSIVIATLNCLKALAKSDQHPDYLTLLSGSCFPVKPSKALQTFLEKSPEAQYIEAVNVEHHRWITEGIQQQRWQLPHYVNWRKHPKLFSLSIKILSLIGVKRRFPINFPVHMGSQWWTLSWGMIEKILKLCEQKPQLVEFLNHTWIPDEFFFQTLVAYLIDDKSHIKPPLMNYQFNCKGIPKIFSFSDINTLNSLPENKFFSRKIQTNDSKFVSLLSRVYLNDAKLPAEVKIINKSGLPDNLRWYKRSRLFSENLDDLPVPCSIIIWHAGNPRCAQTLAGEIKANFPGSGVYGNVFAPDSIDYGTEEPLLGYQIGDTRLRDYDRIEFIQQLCLKHPQGVVFFYRFSPQDELLKMLSSARQVQLLEVFDMAQCDISDLNLLVAEQEESRWKNKKVPQFAINDTAQLLTAISVHQHNSPFYHALSDNISTGDLISNSQIDGNVKQSP